MIAKRKKIALVLESVETGVEVLVMGWVRTKREAKNVIFINLNDGSTINNLQVVANPSNFDQSILDKINTGTAVKVNGTLIESGGAGQKVELAASTIEILGVADPEKFPLQPKKHSLEFLREIAHLRPRTNTFGAIFRIRHAMIFAVHGFFNSKGFLNIHTPIITGSDAEGAGELFKVTTLYLEDIQRNEEGKVDFRKDFFEKETNLTVSGQLEAELAASALGEVYTFGPTFRAENSNTTRHLAEFWMIEPEMAFYDLEDNMTLAEEFVKSVINYVLENCSSDLAFLQNREQEEEKNKPQQERNEMNLIDRLKFILNNSFERITYTEAIDILKNSNLNKKKKFQFLIEEWGTDLQSEHERYLVEKHFKKPVIIYNYPKEIKAFYMRQNEDGKTVAAMDVLFPGIGEIIGGSQREERLEHLLSRINELKINAESLWWYLEIRKFGSVPHSGFGLGFERFVQFVTGMSNIRDVIPFPRTPGNAEF
ncbi:MAG TPA: asparagine--tRNA ligase [Cyclobacteriaceae bacterium]|jgi:asparaginyl-tRNA synthetase